MKTNRSTFASLALLSTLLLPAAATSQKIVGGLHDLQLKLDGDALHISGGNAKDPCGILLGLEKGYGILPGGAQLDIAPLMVLVQGVFDVAGEFTFSVASIQERQYEPLTFYAQAVAVNRRTLAFQTSWSLHLGLVADPRYGHPVKVVHADEYGNPIVAGDQRLPGDVDGEQENPKETDEDRRDPKETDEDRRDPKETDEDRRDPKETDEDRRDPKDTDEDRRDPKETDERREDPKQTDDDGVHNPK